VAVVIARPLPELLRSALTGGTTLPITGSRGS